MDETAAKKKWTSEATRVAKVADALSHPARIAILELLAKKSSCVCGGLVDELPLAQATVSQHLAVLKVAGLVKGTIQGPSTCYCLDPDGLRRAAALLGEAFASWSPSPRRKPKSSKSSSVPSDCQGACP